MVFDPNDRFAQCYWIASSQITAWIPFPTTMLTRPVATASSPTSNFRAYDGVTDITASNFGVDGSSSHGFTLVMGMSSTNSVNRNSDLWTNSTAYFDFSAEL